MQPPTPSHLETLARKTDDWFRRASAALLSLPNRRQQIEQSQPLALGDRGEPTIRRILLVAVLLARVATHQ